MTPLQRFKFLQIFGDGKTHHWFEIIFLGCQHLKMQQKKFENEIFKRALEDGNIVRVETADIQLIKQMAPVVGIGYAIDWKQYDFKITDKGDEFLRNEQIRRAGDISYYKNFDRTITGENGLDHFAPLPKGLKKFGGNKNGQTW